mgnify:FL=1
MPDWVGEGPVAEVDVGLGLVVGVPGTPMQ